MGLPYLHKHAWMYTRVAASNCGKLLTVYCFGIYREMYGRRESSVGTYEGDVDIADVSPCGVVLLCCCCCCLGVLVYSFALDNGQLHDRLCTSRWPAAIFGIGPRLVRRIYPGFSNVTRQPIRIYSSQFSITDPSSKSFTLIHFRYASSITQEYLLTISCCCHCEAERQSLRPDVSFRNFLDKNYLMKFHKWYCNL